MKRCILILIFLAVLFIATPQVSNDISLTLSPVMNIPVAPVLEDGTQFYSAGGGLKFRTEYSIPFMRVFYASGNIDLDLAPINASDSSLTLLSGGGGLGIQISPFDRLSIKAGAYGGLYMGIVEEGSVRNPFGAAEAEIYYRLNPSLSIGLGGGYKHF